MDPEYRKILSHCGQNNYTDLIVPICVVKLLYCASTCIRVAISLPQLEEH